MSTANVDDETIATIAKLLEQNVQLRDFLENTIKEKDATIEKLENKVKKFESELDMHEKRWNLSITTLRQELSAKTETIKTLNFEINAKNKTIKTYADKIGAEVSHRNVVETFCWKLSKELDSKKVQLDENAKTIDKLASKNMFLEDYDLTAGAVSSTNQNNRYTVQETSTLTNQNKLLVGQFTCTNDMIEQLTNAIKDSKKDIEYSEPRIL